MSRNPFDSVMETYRLLFAMGRTPAPASVELPHHGEVVDTLGWKAAHLIDPYTGRFAGISNGSFSMDATATCLNHGHAAPVAGCRCGFHAFHDRGEAAALMRNRWGSVVLRVELYGDIVRHSTGSRAAEQVVTGIYFSERCEHGFCKSPTVGCGPVSGYWVAACGDHLVDGLTLRDVRDILGVPVAAGPDTV